MLYIHGGAFMRGSSGVEMYGPDYLIQKDVVFVSFNYRIGALGMIFDSLVDNLEECSTILQGSSRSILPCWDFREMPD